MNKLQFLVCIIGSFAFASTNGGVVSPITHCESTGTTLEIRVTDCTVPPCRLEAGKVYAFEADFIPHDNCDELGFTMMITFNSTVVIWVGDLTGSSVIGGEAYTFLYPMTPEEELRGENIYITAQITCVESRVAEVCVHAQATIV